MAIFSKPKTGWAHITTTSQHLLPSKPTPFGKFPLATGRPGKNGRAGTTDDNGLGMRVDKGDLHAAGTLDVHEVGAGSLDEVLRKWDELRGIQWLDGDGGMNLP